MMRKNTVAEIPWLQRFGHISEDSGYEKLYFLF